MEVEEGKGGNRGKGILRNLRVPCEIEIWICDSVPVNCLSSMIDPFTPL